MVFKLISHLDDKSAAGIVKAGDDGVIDVSRNQAIIKSARSMVRHGQGHMVYNDSSGAEPLWDDPNQPKTKL